MAVKTAKKTKKTAIPAKSTRKITDYRAETERTMAELAESHKRVELAIESMSIENDILAKRMKEVMEGLSTVGNRLGHIAELVVIPGVRAAINKHKHNFTRSYPNKPFYFIGPNGRQLQIMDADVLLLNGKEVMIVEVKTTLTENDVRAHVVKLQRLRAHEKDLNVKLAGKKIYGAVVGIYVEPKAREVALSNGLYVLDVLEEEEKLKVDAPKTRKFW